MSRWYDKRPRLRKGLDAFKEMDQEMREPILNFILNEVQKNQPSLLSAEQAFDFRLDSYRLRWYEHDPHCWLVFNVLELADDAILISVEDYLANRALLEK